MVQFWLDTASRWPGCCLDILELNAQRVSPQIFYLLCRHDRVKILALKMLAWASITDNICSFYSVMQMFSGKVAGIFVQNNIVHSAK